MPALKTNPIRHLLLILDRIGRLPIFSLLSFVLLIALAWLWIDSRRQSCVLAFFTPSAHMQAIGSDRTGLVLLLSDLPFDRDYALTADFWRLPAADAKLFHDSIFDTAHEKWHFAAFHYARGDWNLSTTETSHFETLLVPYWLILPLLAILPGRIVKSWITRIRRKRHGYCLNCGYDLRHSAQRCPECGTAIPVTSEGTKLAHCEMDGTRSVPTR